MLRGVAFLVRDQNWGTYTPRINSLSVKEGAGQLHRRVQGGVRGRQSAASVRGPHHRIERRRACLRRRCDAGDRFRDQSRWLRRPASRRARRTESSRSCMSTAARRRPAFPNGSVRRSRFSTSARSPMRRRLDLWATCRMEGDAFEMEDQRNWTDASYKTYVRPLALPWGYTLAKGSRHEQSVRLSFTGAGGRRQDSGRRDRDRTGSGPSASHARARRRAAQR